MILSSNNFTLKQFTDDNVKSPVLQSFNNLYYYKFKNLYSIFGDTLYPRYQINAKGNPTDETVKNFIKYYITSSGSFAWNGITKHKTVTGTVTDTQEIFTIPQYNFTDEDLNKWLSYISKNIVLNGGSLLNGSSNMSVSSTDTTGSCVFYLPHDKDFMSKYMCDFPSYKDIIPSKIENGIIDGMYQPWEPTRPDKIKNIMSYDNLQYFMGMSVNYNSSYYVNPNDITVAYTGFDNDDELNNIALNDLDNISTKPYSCNFWDADYFKNMCTPNGQFKWPSYVYYFYKPLLGYPIYCISWKKIKNYRSGIDTDSQKRILVSSDTWWVGITKMEAGFFNDPSII